MLSNHTIPLVSMLNQQKDYLIEFFLSPDVEDDTIWENDKYEFLKSIGKK